MKSLMRGAAGAALTPLLLALWCARAAAGAPETAAAECAEVWEGKMYSSTFRAAMCVAPDGRARGVLLLRRSSGEVDTYHFYGEEKDGVIAVAHSSGHRLEARHTAPATVRGALRLANGMKISFDAALTEAGRVSEECAPL